MWDYICDFPLLEGEEGLVWCHADGRCWVFGPVRDNELEDFAEEARGMWSREEGGEWTATPKDGEARSFDMRRVR